MNGDFCTYRVTGKAKASLAIYCSKTIKDHMIEDLVPAKIMGLSSSYCGVVEDDIEILWENEREKTNHNLAKKYDSLDEYPETMIFKAFEIELALSFMALGQEIDSESFLDNLYISVEFREDIYDSIYNDEGIRRELPH